MFQIRNSLTVILSISEVGWGGEVGTVAVSSKFGSKFQEALSIVVLGWNVEKEGTSGEGAPREIGSISASNDWKQI